MDRLIELLFHNIYVVVIVAGFLFSLLRKARGDAGRRMPDFGGGGARPETGRPVRSEADRTGGQRPGPTAGRHPQPARTTLAAESGPGRAGGRAELAVMEERERTDREREQDKASYAADAGGSDPYRRTRPAAAAETPQRRQAKPAGGPLQHIGQDELKRAIVLAEVLGPPRAKRPYRGPQRP